MREVGKERIRPQVVSAVGEKAAGTREAQVNVASEFYARRRHITLYLAWQCIGERFTEKRRTVEHDFEEIPSGKRTCAVERVDRGDPGGRQD